MAKPSDVLTKNIRNWIYLRDNSSSGRRIANSKLRTKKVLRKHDINLPKLLATFKNKKQVVNFPWETLTGNFVIKPASSSGGDGILIIRKRSKWAGEWFLMNGKKVDISDLRFHCFDILQGRFNLRRSPDKVFIEERVKIHPKFLRFTRAGTPDIRVIVFNNVPVMAMLRIPTDQSNGKANLHQGAIGLGIDLATGITTFGVQNDGIVKMIYDRRRKKMVKVNGIKIPFWKRILELSIECQNAISSLRFLGVDLILDKDRGPLVLELNARPGLSIQICNRAGLKRRLERVEGLKVRNTEHAIRISRSLFGSVFADRVRSIGEVKVLSHLEPIRVATFSKKGPKKADLIAKVDTGAFRSSLDKKTAKELGLLQKNNILYYRHYRSSLGRGHRRPVIGITFWLKGEKVTTAVNVTNREKLRTKFLIGRKDLQGFMVKLEK